MPTAESGACLTANASESSTCRQIRRRRGLSATVSMTDAYEKLIDLGYPNAFGPAELRLRGCRRGIRGRMTNFGYTLMTEQSGPKDLVRYAVSAEHVGFDFEVSSDHYSPWLASQGHAPHAWTT